MFLSRRATQAEYFDALDRPEAEIVESYRSLATLNRFFIFAEPFQRGLPKSLGHDRCRSLSCLDLGAGDGSLGTHLSEWASKRGWNWRFTNLDVSLPALRLCAPGANIAGSVLALPFHDGSFDVVIASQMTHHLAKDEEIILHLREAWRVARRGIFLADLRRGPVLYGILWLLFHLRRFPRHFRYDALLSVKRGFTVNELQALADRAGLNRSRASSYYASRVILQAWKNGEIE